MTLRANGPAAIAYPPHARLPRAEGSYSARRPRPTDALIAAARHAREHGTEWSTVGRTVGLDATSAERLWGQPATLGQPVTLVGHARVSTVDQHAAMQHDALNEAGVIRTFTDTSQN